ncbi:hypothetical protein MXD59_21360 [Frankia sp. Ag45/Mut15]|uniref:Uncharacterized protein n=1 Tax=Frankia umida TaxID=573489 RepID=A0ABT0K3I1_9ACTN|nr:hypothetical protein [Frankia umida]MCK9878287.1 hypothetical protein [Frankia umida]
MDFFAPGYNTPEAAARRAHEQDMADLVAATVSRIREILTTTAQIVVLDVVADQDEQMGTTLRVCAMRDFFGDPLIPAESPAFQDAAARIAADLAVIYRLTPTSTWRYPRTVSIVDHRSWLGEY